MAQQEQITIAGRVLYNDGTPAADARVEIWDEDGIIDGVTGDDRVLRTNTAPDGTFGGQGIWLKDEAFGPDLLVLRFVVTVNGRHYKGSFFRLGAKSVPIVLRDGPPKPVQKSERELLQVILLADYEDRERDLYDFVEVATEGLTRQILGGTYNKITFIKGPEATVDNVVAAVSAAAGRSGVEAVDLIWSTHGNTDRVVLADRSMDSDDFLKAFEDLSDAHRAKLRVCFSTACFGQTHLDMWQRLGFSDASGSKRMYADSALSYAPLLTAWAAERTFAEAVMAANAADIGDVADEAARAFYRAKGDTASAKMIDSTRVRAGSGATRVYSTP